MFYGAFAGLIIGVIPFCYSSLFLKTKKHKALIWIGLVVGAILGLASSPLWIARDFDNSMIAICSKLNQQYPMMVDSITRIDSTSVGPDRTFIYHYTLLGDTRYDPVALKVAIKPILLAGFHDNPAASLFKQYDVKLEYDYSYEDGTPLLKVGFNARDVP